MKIIDKPEVFYIGETQVNWEEVGRFLERVGASDFEFDEVSDAEGLSEFAGRFCYKSFGTGLNPNVTKIREGNKAYLDNVIKQKHGSIFEHSSVNFAIAGVSRVFTHELVRHRVGTAFSQESLRYVRLEELTAWYPESFGVEIIGKLYDALAKAHKVPNDPMCRVAWIKNRVAFLRKIFVDTYETLEKVQKNIADNLLLNELSKDFHIKKAITSSMRRLAPIGLGTGIVFTSNHRNLRNVIEQRTSEGAEEEIRIVFREIAKQMKQKYPNIYGDMEINAYGEAKFESSKI